MPNLYNLYEIRPYLRYFSMDGVFLMKRKRWIGLLICLVFIFTLFSAVYDKQQLRDRLIRLHVVANSDSETDQTIKLTIRDVVLDSIQSDLGKIADIAEAKEYLQQNIPKIIENFV